MSQPDLPVAIIGAGPIGLAAAAHLISRGLPVRVYEAGDRAAANVQAWGHVRLFSPWRFNIDPAARALLLRTGWVEPKLDHLPTGNELHADYLAPLAATPEISAVVETRARVTGITRLSIDRVASKDRERHPLVLSIDTRDGHRRDLAAAVIDASGTWNQPNPLGAGGVPADGEAALSGRITYGLPDVLGRDRHKYLGRSTLVIGAGYSAADVLLDLAELRKQDAATSIHWITRSTKLMRVYGGGDADRLPARGELGSNLRHLVERGPVTLTAGFAATAVRDRHGKLVVEGDTAEGIRQIGPVDEIVVATGQRPDLSMTRELRLDLDPWLESTKALGPLIDPNVHFCGSVPPHGHRELAHPEPNFYTIGIKSYGRAPTFLLLTGYEQARSVAAALAGDFVAADDLQLTLPETGVCVTLADRQNLATAGCCGGPAPDDGGSCCAADADAKSEGKAGCGCSVAA